ncbi:hypothetical protein [Mycolicibacterium sp. YH-1]|uniref:hypothetical protein n=1 Tax=Mycolicibacterium sp. YH-1 TaxID=2908837 RepID=UPI001F4C295A|nr:hypothetical protein [Mycolicibacterium sp. YH-1]UNB50943.1 hypothetical protein L0M16_23795 [Mycolicibacterium sp. YH-1]
MSRSYPPRTRRSTTASRSTSHASSRSTPQQLDQRYGDYGSSPGGSGDSAYGSYGSYGSYSSRYGRSEQTTQLIDESRYAGPGADPAYDDRRGASYDDAYDDTYGDGYDDSEIYEYYEPIDRRWIWVAGVAGAILLIAVICTVVILGGGDSGAVSATVNPPAATTSAPATSTGLPEPSFSTARPAPSASLPLETITTVAPTPSATLAPTPAPAPAPAIAAPVPNAVTYSVTGNRSLIDLVTVIYTDQQGALQTDLNVALPWHKTVILDPGVTLSSVTATSITGQLNCSIADGAGAVIAAQNNNSMIATCTR